MRTAARSPIVNSIGVKWVLELSEKGFLFSNWILISSDGAEVMRVPVVLDQRNA